MSVELNLKYLGAGQDSRGVKFAVIEITRSGVGSRNIAVPFGPGHGLDPAECISAGLAALEVPMLTPKRKSELLEECQSTMETGSLSGKEAIIADRPGWQKNGQYLTPAGKLFGRSKIPVAVLLDGVNRPHRWSVKGTRKAWKKTALHLASKNPAIIFMCASALAGPLLKLVGLEGTIFGLLGETSIGKTKSLDFAGSVIGGDLHEKLGFKSSWRTTENAAELVAREGNDGIVVFDDTLLLTGRGKEKGEAFANLISNLVSGGEKRRFNAPAGSTAPRILGWSASNRPMREILTKAGVYGEMFDVRYIEIPAKWRFGMFNAVPEGMTPAEYSQALFVASRENFGGPYDRYLARLVKWKRVGPRKLRAFLADRRAEALAVLDKGGGAGSVDRTAEYFALVYQAGCLARKFSALPWSRKTLLAAVVDCWEKHRLHVTEAAGSGNPVVILRQHVHRHLHEFVNAGAAVDELSSKARKKVPGFLRRDASGDLQEYIFLQSALRNVVGGDDRLDLLVAELRQKKLLVVDGSKTCPKRTLAKDWRVRVYCVSPRLLTEN